MAARTTSTLAGKRSGAFILPNERYPLQTMIICREPYLNFIDLPVLPPHDQYKALAVLCQLLPHENRNTLRELLNFFRLVVNLQDSNKMSQQNVATIIAPSLFPPR